MPLPPELKRGPRDALRLPEAEIEIPPPTPVPAAPSGSFVWLLVPAAFTIVGLGAMFIFGGGSAQNMLPVIAISVPMMLGSYVVSIVGHFTQKRTNRRKLDDREQKYRAMLQQQRLDLERLRRRTRDVFALNDPDPRSCLSLVENLDGLRLWARSPHDDDFLALRLGLGELPFQVTIKPPRQQSPLDPDPLIQEAQELAAEFIKVADVPVCVPLGQAGVIGLAGPRDATLNAVRALVVQLASHHSPRDVKIVSVYSALEASAWEWMRWLPHVWSDDRSHRFLAQDVSAAHQLLDSICGQLNQRRSQQRQTSGDPIRQHTPVYVTILADPRLAEGQPILPLLLKHGVASGAFSVFLADRVAGLPKECQVMVSLASGIATIDQRIPFPSLSGCRPDLVSVAYADRLARTMAPIRLKVEAEDTEIPAMVRLLDVLGVQQVEELDVLTRWKASDPYRSMAVPVGKRTGGKLQNLDLHERRGEPDIDTGHGPHALVAGTTGSGKSELLASLVASLAVHFHPHQVVFVLLDFKPPGMAEALSGLPHVVNVIDLSQIDMVPRALKSLGAELLRRSQLFTHCGVKHIDEYNERHGQHDIQAAEVLPYLVLIVDEFTVLRDKLPETMSEFVHVAILGRAFGFRMILATQKPAGVISSQIDANTGLRLCLRVAKPEDSQEVIKRPDAASLTGAGRVYMRVGEDAVFELFQSAWSGAPYVPAAGMNTTMDEISEVALDGSRCSLSQQAKPVASQHPDTQLNAVVAHVRVTAEQAGISPLRGPWLQPLPRSFALDDVRPARGWDGRIWQSPGHWLCPVIGLQDDPANQCQPQLQPDLGRRGHLFICSGPGSDNRQVLRTLVTSLASDHSPAELNLYCLDLGGLGLQAFEGLPHVGSVIRKDEPRRIDRLFRWLLEELASRKRWLARRGVGTLAEAHSRGVDEGTPPALVLVVDNLAALGSDMDAVDALVQLARDGLAAGIHLVLAGDQTAAKLFSRVLDNVALRIALQLGGVAEYRMVLADCPRELFLPRDVAGRGLCDGRPPLECQVASPVSGGTADDPESELVSLIAAMREAWVTAGGKGPVSIGMLPAQVLLSDLLNKRAARLASRPPSTALTVPIGLDDLTLEPISVDLAEGPHFVIAGPAQGGKTTALFSWVLGLAECFQPDMVQFFVLDSFKGSLAVLSGLPHVCGYGAVEQDHQTVVRDLEAVLTVRRSERRTGARPALVLVVDDVEFLTGESIKSRLTDHVRHDHPFGFHAIIAGAAAEMAQYDPFRKQVLSNRSGLLVGCNDPIQDTGLFNLTPPPGQSRQILSPGRAYLVRRGQLRLIQIASPGDIAAIRERVGQIGARQRPSAPPSAV